MQARGMQHEWFLGCAGTGESSKHGHLHGLLLPSSSILLCFHMPFVSEKHCRTAGEILWSSSSSVTVFYLVSG